MIDVVAMAVAKELNQLKLNSIFSPHTAKLCNSSLCNGIIGTFVDEIIYLDVEVIESKDLFITSSLTRGDFLYSRTSDDSFCLKQLFSHSPDKSDHLILCHELKDLKYLGPHPNFIVPVGITELGGKPTAVFKGFGMTSTLDQYPCKLSYKIILWIFQQLLPTFQFLHEKGILLNNLIDDAISMDFILPRRFPVVITDFTFACHVRGSKPLTAHFQSKFARTKHLPTEVLLGNKPPSPNSDIYSLGVLISRLSERMDHHSTEKERSSLGRISINLLTNKKDHFSPALVQFATLLQKNV